MPNEKGLLSKQQMSFPNFQPYLEPVRSYIKTAYKTYLLLSPEMRFGQCLYKYLYMKYPILRYFRVENLRLVVRRAYRSVVRFLNSILSGSIFGSPETEADKERVGLKVAMMTKERQAKKQNFPQSNLANYGIYTLPQSTVNYNYLPANYVYQRVRRQSPQFHTNQPQQIQNAADKKHIQQLQKQANHPSQFIDNNQDFEDMDSDAKIDLTNPNLEYEADQLFNLDSLFWKSLGIEDNSIKKYSLAYCAREYSTSVFQRFLKNVLLK